MSAPSVNDLRIVRDYAKQVAEIAADPIQAQKAETWRDHNDLKPHRPMVLIFPEGSWDEIRADWTLASEHPLCRGLEFDFRTRLYAWWHLRDDAVWEATVNCPATVHNTGFGLDAAQTASDLHKGAYHIEPILLDDADIDKIKTPRITVDWDETNRRREALENVIDGILEVVPTCGWGGSLGWCPLDDLAKWRGIDNLMLDLVLKPDWVHAIMQRLLAGKLAEIEALENQGLLSLNNRSNYNGSGGVGYTRQLPQADFDGRNVRLRDLWGSATAQIFSEVSPAMHEEFALHYERQFMERFGLSNYGCCEPLHLKLDAVLKTKNLRRVSISPWADIETCAERLQADYVFSWKPNPAVLAAPTWNPQAVRKDIVEFCEKTRGCVTDIIMKDTHTCLNQPQRLAEWVDIALDVAKKFAG